MSLALKPILTLITIGTLIITSTNALAYLADCEKRLQAEHVTLSSQFKIVTVNNASEDVKIETASVHIVHQSIKDNVDVSIGLSGSSFSGAGPLWRASAWTAVVTATILGCEFKNKIIVFQVPGTVKKTGPSAGAAMTVGLLAAIYGKKVKLDHVVTGTINPDGTIGEVGDVRKKATGIISTQNENSIRYFQVPAANYHEVENIEDLNISQVETIYNAYQLLTDSALPKPQYTFAPTNILLAKYKAIAKDEKSRAKELISLWKDEVKKGTKFSEFSMQRYIYAQNLIEERKEAIGPGAEFSRSIRASTQLYVALRSKLTKKKINDYLKSKKRTLFLELEDDSKIDSCLTQGSHCLEIPEDSISPEKLAIVTAKKMGTELSSVYSDLASERKKDAPERALILEGKKLYWRLFAFSIKSLGDKFKDNKGLATIADLKSSGLEDMKNIAKSNLLPFLSLLFKGADANNEILSAYRDDKNFRQPIFSGSDSNSDQASISKKSYDLLDDSRYLVAQMIMNERAEATPSKWNDKHIARHLSHGISSFLFTSMVINRHLLIKNVWSKHQQIGSDRDLLWNLELSKPAFPRSLQTQVSHALALAEELTWLVNKNRIPIYFLSFLLQVGKDLSDGNDMEKLLALETLWETSILARLLLSEAIDFD